ncbi:iron-containing redox enzyme family protein [Pseudonocardia endophytica]|uniref:Heme oxygenase-like protein n=1 Tax=Pseudonocardia endophytica TaxID=401976 RepID=A0A4R1HZR4_PSEEN|nr:iron-containing redox enzyme family protein [Pseudonocardia endophytica]TCK26725.1 heme oxygenase-like protein [Pseudonocardia endophytica]
MTAATASPVDAVLPQARGPLSGAVLALLRGGEPGPVDAAGADPFGDDLQLALHCCYELHYRGYSRVDDELEWDPRVLGLRRELERVFLDALRKDVAPSDDVWSAVDELLVEPVGPAAETGVSHRLCRDGEMWQLREYVAHRSIYHLKEADPQAWVIPRLPGAAKAGLVTVEHDEYGGGDPERMHATLFADMMRELDLSDAYGGYVDAVPGATLAEVNFMSLCGLHRSLRGALVGQFAVVELTSSPGSERLVRAMRRLGAGPASIRFYDEHVEADAVHEQIIRRRVLAPLLDGEPHLTADVVFGIRASSALGDRLGDHLLGCWDAGRSSLRRPLDGGAR